MICKIIYEETDDLVTVHSHQEYGDSDALLSKLLPTSFTKVKCFYFPKNVTGLFDNLSRSLLCIKYVGYFMFEVL